jgi:hypothetical protein
MELFVCCLSLLQQTQITIVCECNHAPARAELARAAIDFEIRPSAQSKLGACNCAYNKELHALEAEEKRRKQEKYQQAAVVAVANVPSKLKACRFRLKENKIQTPKQSIAGLLTKKLKRSNVHATSPFFWERNLLQTPRDFPQNAVCDCVPHPELKLEDDDVTPMLSKWECRQSNCSHCGIDKRLQIIGCPTLEKYTKRICPATVVEPTRKSQQQKTGPSTSAFSFSGTIAR